MADEIVVVSGEQAQAAQEQAVEAIAEEIAGKVQENLQEEEDDTKWVRDLFAEEFATLRTEFALLKQQISEIMSRVPNQETFNTLTNCLTRIAEANIVANSLNPNPSPEIVVTETTPEPEIPVASVEDAEREPATNKKRRNRL